MRRLRWEVEQFRYTTPDCEEMVPYRSWFKTSRRAVEYWQREKDHGRLFLNSGIYLHPRAARRKLVRFRADEPDVIESFRRLFDRVPINPLPEADESLTF